jgi:hypothetical protein
MPPGWTYRVAPVDDRASAEASAPQEANPVSAFPRQRLEALPIEMTQFSMKAPIERATGRPKSTIQVSALPVGPGFDQEY